MTTPPLDPKVGRRGKRAGAVLIGVLVLALGYFVIAPLAQTALLRAQLPQQAQAARASAESGADAKAAADLLAQRQALRLTAEPAYTVAYDQCYTDHCDAGWTVSSYSHKCQLSYVTLVEAPANSAMAAAVAESDANPKEVKYTLIGTSDYLKAAGRTDRVKNPSSFYVTTSRAGTDARNLVDAGLVGGNSIVAYAAADAYRARQLHAESGGTLQAGKRYAILTFEERYFSRNIGCAIGRPIFCDSPLGGD